MFKSFTYKVMKKSARSLPLFDILYWKNRLACVHKQIGAQYGWIAYNFFANICSKRLFRQHLMANICSCNQVRTLGEAPPETEKLLEKNGIIFQSCIK